MEKFEKIKNEILSRAKIAKACSEEYGKASNFAELLKVITDNFDFSCRYRIIDAELLSEIGKDICEENKLYCNVSVGGNNFLLAWDSATVQASGSATVQASGSAYINSYSETIEHEISDKAILRYYYSGMVVLAENLKL